MNFIVIAVKRFRIGLFLLRAGDRDSVFEYFEEEQPETYKLVFPIKIKWRYG